MNFLRNLIRFSPIFVVVFVLISIPIPKHEEKVVMEEVNVIDYVNLMRVKDVACEIIEDLPKFIPKDSIVPDDIQELIYNKSKEHHISFELLLAMVEKESNGNAIVISSTNDYGLLQINEIIHPWLYSQGITDLLDPSQNIDAGCMILKPLFEKYEEMNLVLMAYNMGEGGAKNLWNQGIYSSEYSRKILIRKGELENDYM